MRSQAHHSRRQSPILVLCLLLALPTTAQVTDDPSDSSPALSINTAAGVATVLPASGAGSCTVMNGPFSTTGTPTAPTVNLARPTCGNYMDLPPAAAAPANDVWLRVDPPAGAYSYRFTLFGGTMTNGAMAVYEATSATAPMRLLGCAVGGSLSALLPTLEANCATPGMKLYLRVWNEANRTAVVDFNVCVQAQAIASMPRRGGADPTTNTHVYETPAQAAAAPPFAMGTAANNIIYAFACDEMWLQADSTYEGGDLWLRVAVPASGTLRMNAARGTPTTARVETIALSAYLTSDPNDPTKFRQVGALPSLLATFPTSIPVTTFNWQLSCLPPGADLYIRIHSLKEAQAAAKRFGVFRFAVTAGSGIASPATNNQPCGATPLSLSGSCPVGTTPTYNDANTCNTPGITKPDCGYSNTSMDLWYSFVAPTSGTVHLEASPVGGAPADPAIALYTTGGTGCNGRFTLIACDDKHGPGNSARIIRTGLIPGQTYYVRAWSEVSSGSGGSFTLCVSEPVLPAGHCFYLLDLWAAPSTGAQHVDVQVGGTTTTYSTQNDPTQLFLISVPSGSTAEFRYYQLEGSRVNGAYSYSLTRLGDPVNTLWSQGGGVPVFGPGLPPNPLYTLTNSCTQLIRQPSDCLAPLTVCNSSTAFGSLSGTLPPGNDHDLNTANMGCLDTEANGISWMIFRPVQNGTVAFWFSATTNAATVDLDFAVWDAGPVHYTPGPPITITSEICAPMGPPVRCSSARRYHSTGLLPGMMHPEQEGSGGWGWLSPLPVTSGHAYLIALVRGAGTPAAVNYEMRWTLAVDAAGNPAPGLLGCTPMVLPVEMLFLQAQPSHNAIFLEWATGREKNSDHFVVERSSDGMHFTPIGQVRAAGHSTQRTDYLFLDEAPLAGVNYYRLKLVDNDASTEHSSVVAAVFGRKAGELLLFPNPTTSDLYATWIQRGSDEDAVDIRIVDVMGRLVMTSTLPSAGQAKRIATEMLPPGAYQVSVMEPGGMIIGGGRFVKQ